MHSNTILLGHKIKLWLVVNSNFFKVQNKIKYKIKLLMMQNSILTHNKLQLKKMITKGTHMHAPVAVYLQ